MFESLDAPNGPKGMLDQPKGEGAGSRQTTPARGGAGAASPASGGAAGKIKVLSLRFAKAEEIVTVLQKVFGREVDITADPRTNQLILRGSDEAAAEVSKLLEQLDVNPPSR
jgi:L-alanine-DL-glutamate epimerase-like enolase superfamily enzyme